MAKEWGRSIADQTNVTLELDLEAIFGVAVPNSARLREAIGQEVIDLIRERTQKDEKSWTGTPFKKYSDEYADSIEFKAYDKSKSEPNLTQTGDMLGLMTVLDSDSPGKVTIGWNDTLQSEKAHGHITGNVGVKRDFFGLTSSDVSRIREKFQDEVPTAPESDVNSSERTQNFLEGRSSIGRRSLDSIVDQFFGDEEG